MVNNGVSAKAIEPPQVEIFWRLNSLFLRKFEFFQLVAITNRARERMPHIGNLVYLFHLRIDNFLDILQVRLIIKPNLLSVKRRWSITSRRSWVIFLHLWQLFIACQRRHCYWHHLFVRAFRRNCRPITESHIVNVLHSFSIFLCKFFLFKPVNCLITAFPRV